MKKFLLLFVLFACSNKEKIETPPSPTVVDEKAKRIVYEGIIKTEHGEGPVELSLVEAETGLTAPFDLKGDIAKDVIFAMARGEYSTLSGASGNEVILQLHGRFFVFGRAQKAKKGKGSFVSGSSSDLKEFDLFFITQGGNKLVLVDEDFDRIADDNRYTLYRRKRQFTVEGYITLEDSHTEFYEQNTNENWSVASLGVYDAVHHIYDSLVTQKSEGMYLKALAYAIESDSTFNEPRTNYISSGVGTELLVIKRVLEMKKSDAYTNKERAAGLGYK